MSIATKASTPRCVRNLDGRSGVISVRGRPTPPRSSSSGGNSCWPPLPRLGLAAIYVHAASCRLIHRIAPGARGHIDPRVEFVVRETSRNKVVEKFGVAAMVATRLEPRFRNRASQGIGS
jgi:hypothetical protein